jgi:Zn-dependent protease
MTPFVATLALELILISPFMGAACTIAWAIRALVTGEVVSYGRVLGRRTISRSANPIQFWMELGLYGVTVAVLLALGLMFFPDTTRFFHELVRDVSP